MMIEAVIKLAVGLVVGFYLASLFFIVLYSLTQLHLLYRYLFLKKKYLLTRQAPMIKGDWPLVTVQLPLYNELQVAGRLIDCITQLNYPAGKLQIQVLDDSSDDTVRLVAAKIAQHTPHLNIQHLHRTTRTGYKAGALREALPAATGEYIALFDADFLPAKDFLLNTIPHFNDSRVGMVQTKWSWLNKHFSLLTRLQAFALDAHFSVEQVGRNIGQGFINFNGTAGVWRKSCIIDAGNWHADTLTEDLDLSYRAQLKNWRFVYLENISSPSELPPVISAVKSQQYRWNKGGAETARKHLGNVFRSSKKWPVKWHALMHLLTSGLFLCAFTCAVLSVPVLWIQHFYPASQPFLQLANYGFLSFLILGVMYLVASVSSTTNKVKAAADFFVVMPTFLTLSMGLSLHNAIAVIEGYLGKQTPFVRTPKFNQVQQSGKLIQKRKRLKPFPLLIFAEAALAIYFLAAILLAWWLNDYSFVLFHVLVALGYSAVVYLTITE